MKFSAIILLLSSVASALVGKEFRLQDSEFYFVYDPTEWKQVDLGSEIDDLWGFSDRLLYLDSGLISMDYLKGVDSPLHTLSSIE